MQIDLFVNRTNVSVDLPGVEEGDYIATAAMLDKRLSNPQIKNREAIRDAFLFILERSPKANASDLWHHVVYRLYCDAFNNHRDQDAKQSWVRASGDALEVVLQELYTPVLIPHGIRIKALISRDQKRKAIEAMGLGALVGDSKLDVILDLQTDEDEWQVFGGVHIKASLAERVSDDVPCSRGMMAKGFWSPLWTLDVKSFPPPQGNLVNKGEMGTPKLPSEKRKYIEAFGEFDNCYSANSRTVPSQDETPSGKRVHTLSLSQQPDQFAVEAIEQAKRRLR